MVGDKIEAHEAGVDESQYRQQHAGKYERCRKRPAADFIPGDPKYRGRYTGSVMERDASYHNGAVWPWLIGAFLSGYLRVNNRSKESIEQARKWLQPLIDQMETHCIGQIWEIHEGSPPHRPVGCPAQAWSVAEVLRLAVELEM